MISVCNHAFPAAVQLETPWLLAHAAFKQLSGCIIWAQLVDCYLWLLFRTTSIMSFNLCHVVPWPRIKAVFYVSIGTTQFLRELINGYVVYSLGNYNFFWVFPENGRFFLGVLKNNSSWIKVCMNLMLYHQRKSYR